MKWVGRAGEEPEPEPETSTPKGAGNIRAGFVCITAVAVVLAFCSDARKFVCPVNHFARFYTDGITNKIFYSQPVEYSDKDRLIFRVYGRNSEIVIDRQRELRNWLLLHRNDCAAPVVAKLDNGLVTGFLPGKTVSKQDVRDPMISREIARTMVKMHSIKLDENYVTLDKNLKRFISAIPAQFDDPEKQKTFDKHYFSIERLKAEAEEVLQVMADLESPLVFCHNDLLLHNILFDKETQKVHFIDYEYSGCNYQAFEIGTHFCEFAGLEVDFSLYPDRELQLKWLQKYLEFWHQSKNLDAPTEKQVERLYFQVNKAATASHLFCAAWGAVQASFSTFDFDYLQYGGERMKQYWKFKEKYFPLKLPDL